jgi:hypothetical protein
MTPSPNDKDEGFYRFAQTVCHPRPNTYRIHPWPAAIIMVMPRFGWRERVRPAYKLRHSGDIRDARGFWLIKQVIRHPVETLAPQIVFAQR